MAVIDFDNDDNIKYEKEHCSHCKEKTTFKIYVNLNRNFKECLNCGKTYNVYVNE